MTVSHESKAMVLVRDLHRWNRKWNTLERLRRSLRSRVARSGCASLRAASPRRDDVESGRRKIRDALVLREGRVVFSLAVDLSTVPERSMVHAEKLYVVSDAWSVVLRVVL